MAKSDEQQDEQAKAHRRVAAEAWSDQSFKQRPLTGASGAANEGGESLQREPDLQLIAYLLDGWESMPLTPAPIARDWMDATYDRFAQRCLPLLIANQAGWQVANSGAFRTCWDGGDKPSSVRIMYLKSVPPCPARSIFGYGIVTFQIPYLFRTPPGFNLLVRGPANLPKDGASALEGLVETDWSVATFTMNWKLTRPDHVVTFEDREPICMVVPQARGELEAFRPALADLAAQPELERAHAVWDESRLHFIALKKITPPAGAVHLWQRHYFRGTAPDGTHASVHQTRLRLRTFEESHGTE